MHVTAANSTDITFEGVLVFDFSLLDSGKVFKVPVLVTSQKLSEPILGYNIIEFLILDQKGDSNQLLKSFVNIDNHKLGAISGLNSEKSRSS